MTEALLQRSAYHHTGAHYHRSAHHNTWWALSLSCVCLSTPCSHAFQLVGGKVIEGSFSCSCHHDAPGHYYCRPHHHAWWAAWPYVLSVLMSHALQSVGGNVTEAPLLHSRHHHAQANYHCRTHHHARWDILHVWICLVLWFGLVSSRLVGSRVSGLVMPESHMPSNALVGM